jgi:hypothetical protein
MYIRRETQVVAMALLGIAAVFACSGGDSGGGSDNMVEFPSVSTDTLDNLCIRGELSAPGQKAGEIGAADCDDLDAGRETREAYRVRVEDSTDATFVVNSGSSGAERFDSYLELYRVNDPSNYEASLELLASDDDSSHGVDALLTHRLEPDIEYVIFVSGGFTDPEGPYTLDLRIVFSIVPPAVETELCIRGSLFPPANTGGEIDTGDCADPGPGFSEAYRVGVNGEEAIPATFDLSPNFLSTLELFEVTDVSDYVNSLTLLESGADFVEHSLEPGTEYLIIISGEDDTELGVYFLDTDDG